MRLGTLFLTAAVAAAAPPSGSLPWASARALPWDPAPCLPSGAPAPLARETALPLSVLLSQDGALRILDEKGGVRLRMGLPGRPLRL